MVAIHWQQGQLYRVKYSAKFIEVNRGCNELNSNSTLWENTLLECLSGACDIQI